MGINREFHYPLKSEETWHAVGNCLAPKYEWDQLLDKPGLKSLVIEGIRSEGEDGYIQVKVEPSARIEFGVYLHINDHYQFSEELTNTSDAITILSNRWSESMSHSLEIANQIASLGEEK